MKSCQVWGDMTADSLADIYPTVAVCDDCVESYEGEVDSPIVAVENYDPAYGDECHLCDKSIEDEAAEQGREGK